MQRLFRFALGCAIVSAGLSSAQASHGHGGGGGHSGGGHHSGGHSSGGHHSSGGMHHSHSMHHGGYGGGSSYHHYGSSGHHYGSSGYYGGFYPGFYGGYGGYGRYGSGYGYGSPYYYNRGYGYGSGYGYGGNYTNRVVVMRPQQVGDGGPIKIFNLADSGTALHFQISGTEYALQPGESMYLVYDRGRTLTFDRGGEFGTGEYALTSGQYWFEVTPDHGWEMYHDADVSKLAPAAKPQ